MPEEDTYSFDTWETSSGLPDKITVRIDNPHFGTDAQINDGQTTLFIPEGTIIAGTEDGSAVDFNQFYSCGDGWEAAGKGGARLVREDGRARKINGSSNFGKFITSLARAADGDGVLDQLKARGPSMEAATYAGLEVYMERIEQPEFMGRDGKPVKRDVLLPVKITGGLKGTSAEPAEKATVKGAGTNGDTAAASGDLDPKVKAKLRAIARECDTHEAFMEKGFEVDGVLNDPVAEDAVAADGPGSIWAEVNAS